MKALTDIAQQTIAQFKIMVMGHCPGATDNVPKVGATFKTSPSPCGLRHPSEGANYVVWSRQEPREPSLLLAQLLIVARILVNQRSLRSIRRQPLGNGGLSPDGVSGFNGLMHKSGGADGFLESDSSFNEFNLWFFVESFFRHIVALRFAYAVKRHL